MEKNEGPQSVVAKTIDSSLVVHDHTIVTETIDLEVDETTPSNLMVRDSIFDQLVEDIVSDILSEDMRGLTNPTDSKLAKLVEKKRKTSGIEFTLLRFKVKSKKLTRCVQMKRGRMSVYL